MQERSYPQPSQSPLGKKTRDTGTGADLGRSRRALRTPRHPGPEKIIIIITPGISGPGKIEER